MLRDFFSFLLAIWEEWRILLTGGSVIAISAMWTFWTGKALPRNTGWLILGLTLVLATFFAWRKEWIAGSRGFIEISPEQLSQLVRNRTSLQAATVIKPYIGKSIRTTLFFNDVITVGPFFAHIYLRDTAEPGGILIRFWAVFWQLDMFKTLHKGVRVSIAGRIKEVESYSIELSGVTLLNIEEPSRPPTNPR